MYNFVYQKYFRNPDHKKELLRSHPYEIVEWNRWHDNFWGCCVCPRCAEKDLKSGNYLGKILMKVRDVLISG